jgi:hypothetical protein
MTTATKTTEIFYTFCDKKTNSLSFELGEMPLFNSIIKCKEYAKKFKNIKFIKVKLSEIK